MAVLDAVFDAIDKVIAEIIEAEFVVRAVGDVRAICFLARHGTQEFLLHQKTSGGLDFFLFSGLVSLRNLKLRIIDERSARDNRSDGESEQAIDLSHPHRVAAGKIFVDGDDVHALTGERIQVCRRDPRKRLSFSGHHLGDRAAVQHESAEQLDVERALVERALRRLAHEREGLHSHFVQYFRELASLYPLTKRQAFFGQFAIGKRRHGRLQSVDFFYFFLERRKRPLLEHLF